ncbi:radical SAM/SPASM domain-containing protein [Thermodesulfobacteriota bacterium]
MEEKIRRLSRWALGETAPPVTIELNPTNRCNLKCRSCWQRHFEDIDRVDRLTPERLILLIREAGDLGVREFRIPGSGEPLVRPDLFDAMLEIKRQGMHGLLITNGTLFDERRIEALVDLAWDCITFSIDGPDAETNDYLRGVPGTFEKTISALEGFQAAKARRGTGLPLIRFTTVLSNRNHDKITQMMELAGRVGCEDLQVQPMTVWGEAGALLELDQRQRDAFQEEIPRALALAEGFDIFTNLGDLADTNIVEQASDRMDEAIEERTAAIENPFLALPCFEPWYNMIILPDGRTGPCSMSGGADGDTIVDKSLADVWYGGSLETMRKRLLDRDLPPYCKRCCAVVFVENNRLREGIAESLEGA